jgi:hypothetical protein
MSVLDRFDALPIWAVFLLTAALISCTMEAGFRLGLFQRRVSQVEDKPSIGEIVAATLALLAFLLTFTFGFAASRHDVRRNLVVEEANAIGTTALRALMLPEPHRSEIRKLLREYVDVRLDAMKPGRIAHDIARSESLHTELWNHAVQLAESKESPILVSLFIQSLNQTIDLHARRLALGLRTRVPVPIWVTLYFIAILGTSVLGYHAGLAHAQRSLATLALILGFSAVMTLIADLDHPIEGLIQINQESLMDLQRTLESQAVPPPAKLR